MPNGLCNDASPPLPSLQYIILETNKRMLIALIAQSHCATLRLNFAFFLYRQPPEQEGAIDRVAFILVS
jgi:hypothetical protein